MDVTEPEPLLQDCSFWHHLASWLTPHITSQLQGKMAVQALPDNIRRFKRSGPMPFVVDGVRGYRAARKLRLYRTPM